MGHFAPLYLCSLRVFPGVRLTWGNYLGTHGMYKIGFTLVCHCITWYCKLTVIPVPPVSIHQSKKGVDSRHWIWTHISLFLYRLSIIPGWSLKQRKACIERLMFFERECSWHVTGSSWDTSHLSMCCHFGFKDPSPFVLSFALHHPHGRLLLWS